MWRESGAGLSPEIEREAIDEMNHKSRGVALMTKWVLEANEDPASPCISSDSDVASEEGSEDLDPLFGPYINTIDNPDLESLEGLLEWDGLARDADSVGGWIVETQDGARKELDLFDPDAPSKERIARPWRLHRLHPLLWF